MTYDELADRCLLFVEERKQMITVLLKEAELEMTRKCNMYEDTRSFTCDGSESYALPENYKQVIFLSHDGFKLQPTTEDDISYADDGTIQAGTPSGYFIRNNAFHLNYKASSGTLRISYYGTVDNIQDSSSDPSPIIPKSYHRDLCDYAIAIAHAKNNPQLHDKYLMSWNRNIAEIINEDANRELIHTIKREV